MRVLHITTDLSEANGVAVFVENLSAELIALGHKSVIATCDNKNSLDEEIDLVHVHALWTPWLSWEARRFRLKGVPVVWSPHGMLTSWAMHNKRIKKLVAWWLYQRSALRSADLLHVTASCEIEDVRRMGLNNPVVLAPLGVHVMRKEIDCRAKLSSRESGTRTLLFVSRVQRKKGLPNLLSAWAQLPHELRAQWRVQIAGPDEDNHIAELQCQAARLGISSDVEFLGPVYGDAKRELYAQADLFVLPTYSENFGSVVIESLAEGTPVICTKGAPWEELRNFRCGWWIDIGVDPLAACLREAMALDDNTRLEMGIRGRKLVADKYSWQAVGKTMSAAYERLIRKG